MRLTVCLVALVAANAPTSQIKPDFSGVWTFSVPSSAQPGPPTPAFQRTWTGDPVTITQTTTSLTVEYTSNSRAHQPVKLVYNLDGTERTNVDKNSLYPEQKSHAVWRGAALVLTIIVPRLLNGEPDPVEITEILSLESPTSMSAQIAQVQDADRQHGGAVSPPVACAAPRAFSRFLVSSARWP